VNHHVIASFRVGDYKSACGSRAGPGVGHGPLSLSARP
jgi:hypothetical protein